MDAPRKNVIVRFFCFIKTKPWYIWLSLLAFMSFAVVSMLQSDGFVGAVKCWWNLVWVSTLVLMLPILVLLRIVGHVLILLGVPYDLINSNDSVGIAIMMYVCIYIFGVLASCVHVAWREKNIVG